VLWANASPYGAANRVVVQGIFSHTEVLDGGPWGIEKESRFVFIGKIDENLRNHLHDGLRSCLSSAQRRNFPSHCIPAFAQAHQPSTNREINAAGSEKWKKIKHGQLNLIIFHTESRFSEFSLVNLVIFRTLKMHKMEF
tara:strand:- start:253 stop:669 length:417 start_codon:yes stop_codon:yes gene_type:complete